jgi:hypothetical protein
MLLYGALVYWSFYILEVYLIPSFRKRDDSLPFSHAFTDIWVLEAVFVHLELEIRKDSAELLEYVLEDKVDVLL